MEAASAEVAADPTVGEDPAQVPAAVAVGEEAAIVSEELSHP